jgi:predicted deacylase
MPEQGQLTATSVAQHLLALSRQLDEVTTELNAKDIEATELAEEAKLEEAKAFVKAEGSVDFRKATATINTHQVRLDAKVAEATVRGLIRTVRTLQSRIDVGRSHGATVRAETQLAGRGEGA